MEPNILLIARETGRLKRIKRTGWAVRCIPEPESVADHSFRVAVLAMTMGDRLGLDTGRMVRMALLHELSESRTGDIPTGAVPEREKAALERAVEVELLEASGDDGSYLALLDDFREGRTREARLVRDLDRLEFLIQAREYEDAGHPVFAELYADALGRIREPEVRALAEALR